MAKYLSHLGPRVKSDGRHFSGKSATQAIAAAALFEWL